MERDTAQVFWAKMPGFPWWPARLCALYEEIDLEQLMIRRPNQVAMLFFEKKAKKAWVNEGSVEEFNFTTLIASKKNEPFSHKLFSSNVGYRNAVIEAARVFFNRLKKEDIDETARSVISMIQGRDPTFPGPTAELRSDGVGPPGCQLCSGTTLSGELRACCSADTRNGRCGGTGRVHYHCFEKDSAVADLESRWYCTACAKSYGWVQAALLPEDPCLVPYFGVIDRFLPASGPGQNDQLYHAQYEDGDGEEYYEDELGTVLELYDQLKGGAHNAPHRAMLETACRDGAPEWTKQHAAVGARVCKFFAGALPENDDSARVEEVLARALETDKVDGQELDGSSATKSTTHAQERHPDMASETAKAPSIKAPPKPAQPQRRSAILLESQTLPAPIPVAPTSSCSKTPLHHQLLGMKRPADCGQEPLQVAFDGPRIKKKLKTVELDDDHSLADEAQPPSHSGRGMGTAAPPITAQSPTTARAVGGAARPGGFAIQAPLRPDRCVNPLNVPIVRFFEECLDVMTRHKANIERARRRTFETKLAVARDVAHQVVEDMAGDLIKSIRNHLDDGRSSSGSFQG